MVKKKVMSNIEWIQTWEIWSTLPKIVLENNDGRMNNPQV